MRHDDDNTWGHKLYCWAFQADQETGSARFKLFHDEKCTIPVKSSEIEELFYENVVVVTDMMTGNPEDDVPIKPTMFLYNSNMEGYMVPSMGAMFGANGILAGFEYLPEPEPYRDHSNGPTWTEKPLVPKTGE